MVTSAQQPSKSAVTHERIIHAAAEVLAERGYAGTRLSDIAERAGIRSGSLYYHFDDRDDIVDQVLQRGVRETRRRVQEAIDALPADADHRRRLETAIVAHLGVILEFGEVSSASLRLLRQLPPELQDRYQADQRRYGEVWGELIRAAQRAGTIRGDIDPVRLRLLIIGQLNWVAEWPRTAVGSHDDLIREAVGLIMDGVAGRREK
jgi:AcrR family transcriptional regulator